MDNGQIKHTDIAEVGVMKPFQDELIATIQIINTMDADLISIAKSLKKALSDGTTTSTDAIRKQTEAVKQAKEAMTAKELVTKQLIKTERDLEASILDDTKALADQKLKLQEVTREIKENAKLTSEQIGAYEKASIKLNQMTRAWKDLAIVNKENSVRGKELKKQIDELDMTLKSVDASMGIHRRNVGNYGNSFNGLSNSINQVTREMPAFVNSAQTGFMAISNNLPMLLDQINLLKQRNAELNAEGQKGVPIWKSVASALFSWQTLMGVGITLMVTYGKEIGNAVKSLFGYKDATEQAKIMQKQFNDEMELSIERIDALTKSQVQEVDFNTQAQIINAKKRGATEKEIREIERKGRELQVQVMEQNSANLYNAARVAGDRLIAMQGVNTKEEIDAQEQKYNQLLTDAKNANDAAFKLSQSNTIKLRQQELDDIENARKIAREAAKKARDERIKEYEAILKDMDDMHKKAEKLQIDYLKAIREQREKEAKEAPQIVDTEKLRVEAQNKLFEYGRKKREKDRKDEAKQEAQLIKSATNLLEDVSKKQLAIQGNKIEKELEATKKRQDDLRELAVRGSQDASNNLVFEERKQAELEAKREKALKNQKKQELLFAGLKAYSANVERNPNTALTTTLKDLTMLTTALSALPSFFDGTEDTGSGGNLDSKGGFKAILHPNERVLTKDQNKKLGDISNEELATIGSLYNKGLLTNSDFDRVPMSRYVDDRLIVKTEQMFNEIKDLKEIIKNRPSQNIQYDELSKIATETIKSQFKSESTSRKIGGLRG